MRCARLAFKITTMSKKAVIVPTNKWCSLVTLPKDDGIKIENYHFIMCKSRKHARDNAKMEPVGTVRKVTKIVYHYE